MTDDDDSGSVAFAIDADSVRVIATPEEFYRTLIVSFADIRIVRTSMKQTLA